MESDECGYSVSVQILQVASLFYRPNNSTKLLFFTITHKLFFILFIPKSALYRSGVDGMECCGSYTTWNGCEIGRCHITSTTIKYTDEYSFCCYFVYAVNPENPLVVCVCGGGGGVCAIICSWKSPASNGMLERHTRTHTHTHTHTHIYIYIYIYIYNYMYIYIICIYKSQNDGPRQWYWQNNKNFKKIDLRRIPI